MKFLCKEEDNLCMEPVYSGMKPDYYCMGQHNSPHLHGTRAQQHNLNILTFRIHFSSMGSSPPYIDIRPYFNGLDTQINTAEYSIQRIITSDTVRLVHCNCYSCCYYYNHCDRGSDCVTCVADSICKMRWFCKD